MHQYMQRSQRTDAAPAGFIGRNGNSRSNRFPALVMGSALLQRKCAACEDEEKMQRKESGVRTPANGVAPPIVHDVLRESGEPLAQPARGFMEERFGRDFGGVRVHSGARAGDSARAVGARAYTVGEHIVFSSGEYAPGSHAGKGLLAHELTHTIQQGSGNHSLQSKIMIGSSNDPAEQEADRVAYRVMESSHHDRPISGGGPVEYGIPAIGRGPSQAQRALFRTPAAKEAGTGAAQQGEKNAGDASASGICLRTPLGPGIVRITGPASVLADFAIMPEDARSETDTITPRSGVEYGADGFWYRHHSPKNEWMKVPNHCDLDVAASSSGFSGEQCCNWAASWFKGEPRWSSDGHRTVNPFR